MKTKLIHRTLIVALLGVLISLPANFRAAPVPQPNIGVNGYYSNDRARRERMLQGAVVIDIPGGYHVNANRPLGKYAIPTALKIEAPRGVTVGPISYPRAIVRKLKAGNNEPLAVYEGRAVLRFNVTVPANYQGGENFTGFLDEFRVSKVVRTRGWIAAQYAAMTAGFTTIGPIETF